jgi:hypothetical protein
MQPSHLERTAVGQVLLALLDVVKSLITHKA